MVDIGHYALVAAWLLSLYGCVVGFIGAFTKRRAFTQSSINSVVIVACLTIISLVALGILFLNHDYRYVYVWQNSNNAMTSYYLISAIWGGMDGSMLFWAALASVFSAIAVFRTGREYRQFKTWVAPILNGSTCFYLVVVTFLTNPFRLIPEGAPLAADGNGLNPLLQNPSMLIHPVTLYAGFTGFVVPFAFCLAALFSGNLGDSWMRITRRWTLVAWGFLTAGIILGGNWAYIELGWGGFWAWDPVENASFLPWLSGTAFLHSAMVQQRRGALKAWNIGLCALTYLLTIFGTFLTRSGIVQSVHAFAETDVGWVFLVYMSSVAIAIIALMVYRWPALRAENRIESYLSREAAFLFNNLALLGICFATLWGVMFPVLSEAFSGEKSVVGPPFFNQVNVPLFLFLIFLMGVGPLIAWRKSSKRALIGTFLKPIMAGSLVTVLFLALDPNRIGAAVSFGLCMFVLGTIVGEFHRGAKVRKELTSEGPLGRVVNLVRRKPQKYGGYLIHFGVVVMVIGITASMAYKIEKDVSVQVGEQLTVGRYQLELESLEQQQLPNYVFLRAKMKVVNRKTNEFIGYLTPERRFYPNSEQTTTEVDIRITLLEDLYLALAGIENASGKTLDLKTARASFKIFVNPLQVWLWVGSLVVLLGTLVVIGPRLRETVREPVTEISGVKVQS